MENHVLASLGSKKIRDIASGDIRTLLLSKRESGSNLQGQKGTDRTGRGSLSRNTVKQIRSVLSTVLSLAVEDEVIGSNPALGLLRSRHTKAQKRRARARVGEAVKAMTTDERNCFLSVARDHDPEVYPAVMLMALAGLRLGEALGLKWSSVDLEERRIHVHEQLANDSTNGGGAIRRLVRGSWKTCGSFKLEGVRRASGQARPPRSGSCSPGSGSIRATGTSGRPPLSRPSPG